ncbi:MAG TPA: hypothetical protein P5300_08575, partial [Acidobacteriota bacterium]|nr:hypothetical protein [Acidobacteriota bacterium]
MNLSVLAADWDSFVSSPGATPAFHLPAFFLAGIVAGKDAVPGIEVIRRCLIPTLLRLVTT